MGQIWILIAALVLASSLGCGPRNRVPPGPTDPARAKDILVQALDAWLVGKTPDSLQSGQSAIIVADYEWNMGSQLASYQIQSEGELVGNSVRFSVRLETRVGTQRSVKKAAQYLVATVPVATVARNDATD